MAHKNRLAAYFDKLDTPAPATPAVAAEPATPEAENAALNKLLREHYGPPAEPPRGELAERLTLIFTRHLSGERKLFLALLASLGEGAGIIGTSIPTIARRLPKPRSTVRRMLRELESLGLLQILDWIEPYQRPGESEKVGGSLILAIEWDRIADLPAAPKSVEGVDHGGR